MVNIFSNSIFLVTLWSWLLSQIIKNAIYILKYKRFNFKLLLTSGGMPSSHSATVSALVTAVGKIEGVSSSIFVVTLILAVIVITDAVGVRRAAGQQARILNLMLEEYYKEGKVRQARLKELIGHTPFEVIIGCILGITVGLLFA
jgi:acid phosphatase family membrane protein YuiD